MGVDVRPVESAVEMDAAARVYIPEADVVIYAAAVADYRPETQADQKRKRSRDGEEWSIALTTNPDIAAGTQSIRKPGAVTVGFALETEDLVENAQAKRAAKGFDLVVANPAGEPDAGFGSETNRVTILGDGEPEALPVQSKDAVADAVLDRVSRLLEARA